MLGKIARNRLGQLLALVVIAGFGYACLLNVSQKANSGKDRRWKGAKKVKLDESGEGKVRGIVTYPGGDRVDWKVVEMPDKGKLKIRLKWKPPRKGLDLAFNVYDQYLKRIKRAKPTPRKNKRSKRVKIRNVEKGKYYIQIYAPRRMDAGKYTLNVQFKKGPPNPPDAGPLDIPNPPKLAAIPVKYDAAPVIDGARPDARLPDVIGKIVRFRKVGSRVRIRINRGKNAGIKRNLRGYIVAGSGTAKLPGSEFTIYRVRERYSLAKVKLSLGQVSANPKVIISR